MPKMMDTMPKAIGIARMKRVEWVDAAAGTGAIVGGRIGPAYTLVDGY